MEGNSIPGLVTRPRRVLSVIDWIMPLFVVLMMVCFSLTTNTFLTLENMSAILTQEAATFIVAAMAGMLLMAGYVDLSIGSTLALSGVAGGLAFNAVGPVGGVLVGLGVGAGVGALNGCLIGLLGLSPIVVTLGLLTGGRAVALYLSPDQVYGFPPVVTRFAIGEVFGISYIGYLAIAVCLAAVLCMSAFPLGPRIQAVGVNARAAFLVGIRVRRTVFALYVLVGLAAGAAGLLTIARLDSAPSGTLGVGFEVTVLTAILLGGVPFTGGRGSLPRVLLGVWLLAVLRNGLLLLNYSTEIAGMVTGAVLILAAALHIFSQAVKRRG